MHPYFFEAFSVDRGEIRGVEDGTLGDGGERHVFDFMSG